MTPPTRVRLFILVAVLGIDCAGALALLALVGFVVPLPEPVSHTEHLRATFQLAAAYAVIGTAVALVIGTRRLAAVASADAASQLTDLATDRVLGFPQWSAMRTGALWLGGAAIAALWNLRLGAVPAVAVGLTFALGALVAGALTYLVAERALRPLAVRALTARSGDQALPTSHLSRRLLGSWVLSSGVGLAGLALCSLLVLTVSTTVSLRTFAMVTLGLTVLVGATGLVVTFLAARAAADPVEDLLHALASVKEGDLTTRVRIWDASELGAVQAGFNQMVAGLQERERLRDLFGRHVGTDVAREALASSADFSGESRPVTVLFIDLVGSTNLAEANDPRAVIGALNALFSIVIATVHDHGGWVNKFMGDAALAVWGAPAEVADASTRALAAARTIAGRVAAELPGIHVGIGVSQGTAVVGNVGGEERYEYTTIGDPVNEAARLTELAKAQPSGVLANATLVDSAELSERQHWVELDAVTVRGRSTPTRLATPG
jgi:adenylate cyclase